jgi:hypothetical protein
MPIQDIPAWIDAHPLREVRSTTPRVGA